MTTVTADSGTAPRTFREVWLISAGHGLTHWYMATFYVLLPLIGKELGLSYTEIGMIMSVQFLAGAISNLPGGMIVDMVGQKGYLMAASLFWVGVPYALMSVTHSFWMLLLCVTLVGIGNNIWHPAAIPTLTQRYPERKGLVLSFHAMGGNLGEAMAPIFVGALLGWFTWRSVVVINVLPGIAMAVLILMMLGAFAVSDDGSRPGVNARGNRQSSRQYLAGFMSLLRNRTLMLVSFSAACRTLTQVGLMTFLPVYLAYEMQYSPFLVGMCMTLLQIAGFLAGPVGGHLSDRIGRRKVVTASMLLSGAMILGMALAGRTAAFVVFIALVGFFLYAMRPVLQAWAVESTPRELAATGVGLQFCISALGASLAPALSGLVADIWDIYTAFYFLAGTIVAANLLVMLVPHEHDMPASPAKR